MVAVRDSESIYREMPEEQKQAFDLCIDYGQMKEAREVLAEYERNNRDEGDNEISGK